MQGLSSTARTGAAAAGLLALGYAGVCVVMFIRQESFVFFPERAVARTPAAADLAYEDVKLRTADGVTIGGWWIPAAEPRGTLILAHGNAGNVSHRLEKLALFHSLRLSVLAFDYRGYGQSQGRPSEHGTYLDMDAAVDFATLAKGEQPRRTIYYGESLGGAVAVEAASRRPPAALILESTFTSVPAMAAVYYPWLPTRLVVTIRYDSLSRAPRLSCATLVLHSPEDDVVPYAMGRALFEAAPGPKSFVELRGGHNDGGILVTPKARDELDGFLTRALGE